MATPPRRSPAEEDISPPPGLKFEDYPNLDHMTQKNTKIKLHRNLTRNNMLALFGQEVAMSPKADDNQEENAAPGDGGEADSVAASSDRAASNDGQPWIKKGDM